MSNANETGRRGQTSAPASKEPASATPLMGSMPTPPASTVSDNYVPPERYDDLSAPPQAAAVHTNPEASSGRVTVACKLPNGLVLRIFDFVDSEDPLPGGGTRGFKIARQRREVYVLRGPAHYLDKPRAVDVAGGFALTPNIPQQFWEEWLAQNDDTDIVKNGLVFAHSRDTAGQARELFQLKSGLEPLSPDKDPRTRRMQIEKMKDDDRE